LDLGHVVILCICPFPGGVRSKNMKKLPPELGMLIICLLPSCLIYVLAVYILVGMGK